MCRQHVAMVAYRALQSALRLECHKTIALPRTVAAQETLLVSKHGSTAKRVMQPTQAEHSSGQT